MNPESHKVINILSEESGGLLCHRDVNAHSRSCRRAKERIPSLSEFAATLVIWQHHSLFMNHSRLWFLSLILFIWWVDICSCPKRLWRLLVHPQMALIVCHDQLGYPGKKGHYGQYSCSTVIGPIQHDSMLYVLTLWTKSK